MSDSIAQSFFINVSTNVDGVFLTRLDLYFQTKDPQFGFTVQLRAMDNLTGLITTTILPFSKVYVPNNLIYVSDDGSVPTSIVFDAPVYVQNQAQYAFVVIPEANSPYLTIWTAELGDNDVRTGSRISEQPSTGVQFSTSNLSTWTANQASDIKFDLYRASFTAGSSGTVTFTNPDMEYLSVTNASGLANIGEYIRGEGRLYLSNVGGTITTDYILTGVTSGTVGRASGGNQGSNMYRVNGILPNKNYTPGETVNISYANNTPTGYSATVLNCSFPGGYLSMMDLSNPADLRVYLQASGGYFVVGEEIRGQTSNNNAWISKVNDLEMNLADIEIQKMDFTLTDSDWTAKTTSSSYTIGSFNPINVNTNNNFATEQKIAGKSNELTYLSGNKSFQVQGQLNTYSDFLSPIVNQNRSHSVIVNNIINNDDTNEDQTSGGNAIARYITEKVTLADGQDAEDINVYLSVYYPSSATIGVYYKILNGEDSDTFDDVKWIKMDVTSSGGISLDSNSSDFREYQYGIPSSYLTGSNGEVQYVNSAGITFTGYKYYSVKVVMLSSSTSLIPILGNIRIVCLQQ